MIVKTYYEGGHVDVFDTDRKTESLPQTGNLLTNYSLDIDNVESGGLWMSSYYYEANDQYRDTVGPRGLPVARRRDGWSFLLADAEDMKGLMRVTVDGENVLMRVGGEFVFMSDLRYAYDVAEDVIPKADKAHDHLLTTLKDEEGIDIECEACRRMGFSYEAYQAVRRTQPVNDDTPAEGDRKLFG